MNPLKSAWPDEFIQEEISAGFQCLLNLLEQMLQIVNVMNGRYTEDGVVRVAIERYRIQIRSAISNVSETLRFSLLARDPHGLI